MCILSNYYILLYFSSNISIFLIDSILIIVIMRYCKLLEVYRFSGGVQGGSREGPGRSGGGPEGPRRFCGSHRRGPRALPGGPWGGPGKVRGGLGEARWYPRGLPGVPWGPRGVPGRPWGGPGRSQKPRACLFGDRSRFVGFWAPNTGSQGGPQEISAGPLGETKRSR